MKKILKMSNKNPDKKPRVRIKPGEAKEAKKAKEVPGRNEYFEALKYQYGEDGYAKNEKTAKGLLELSAAEGFAQAKLRIGLLHESGTEFFKKDLKEAKRWYSEAAYGGSSEAMWYLAQLSEHSAESLSGREKKECQGEAVRQYGFADSMENLQATEHLASIYENGECGCEVDEAKALYYYKKAEKMGSLKAMCRLGDLAYDADNEDEAIMYYEKAAGRNHAEALFRLGKMFYKDEENSSLIADNKKAVTWFKRAAELHHKEAEFYLGRCYFHGRGIDKDQKEAVNYFIKAARKKNKEAQLSLGQCYETGLGVPADLKQAENLFSSAAAGGYDKAEFYLGQFYTKDHPKKDLKKGISLLENAAKKDYAPAAIDLAKRYMQGGLGVVKDLNKAVELLQPLADSKRIPEAQLYLDQCYMQKGSCENPQEAKKWLEKANGRGLGQAKSYLQNLENAQNKNLENAQKNAQFHFLRGQFLYEQESYEEAAVCYEIAAKNGYSGAKEKFAEVHFLLGQLVEQQKNYKEAVAHYEIAAKNGYSGAKEKFAEVHFLLGQLVEQQKNYMEAVAHYEIAVKNGNPDAKKKFAKEKFAEVHFLLGQLVEQQKNYKEAVAHYEIAAKNGNPDAKKKVGTAYFDLATECIRLCKFEEAEDYFRKAMEEGLPDAKQEYEKCHKFNVEVAENRIEKITLNRTASTSSLPENDPTLPSSLQETKEDNLPKISPFDFSDRNEPNFYQKFLPCELEREDKEIIILDQAQQDSLKNLGLSKEDLKSSNDFKSLIEARYRHLRETNNLAIEHQSEEYKKLVKSLPSLNLDPPEMFTSAIDSAFKTLNLRKGCTVSELGEAYKAVCKETMKIQQGYKPPPEKKQAYEKLCELEKFSGFKLANEIENECKNEFIQEFNSKRRLNFSKNQEDTFGKSSVPPLGGLPYKCPNPLSTPEIKKKPVDETKRASKWLIADKNRFLPYPKPPGGRGSKLPTVAKNQEDQSSDSAIYGKLKKTGGSQR